MTFRDMVRPDLNGTCPDGFFACDPQSAPDNIVCIEGSSREAIQDQCPILDLEIIRKDDEV